MILTIATTAFLAVLHPTNTVAAPDAKPAIEAKDTPTKVAPKASASASTKVGKKDEHPAPPIKDDDAAGALERGKEAYEAAKSGNWWHFSALVITVLMFLLKFVGKRQGFWAKMGRWRYVLPPLMSLAAGVLATFAGGVSFEVATAIFGESWATSSLQELWEHGILGKPRASAG